MDGKRIRAFYANATAWSFDGDAEPHIVAARERQAAEFDAWLDRERAAARREGQVEALREAARNVADGLDLPLAASLEVLRFLHDRADWIENGAGQ